MEIENKDCNQDIKIKILLIDDDEAIQLVMEENCKEHGITMDGALRLGQGITMAGSRSYDLVILDLGFSREGLEGMSTISKIGELSKAAGDKCDIVVFTGNPSATLTRSAIEAGASKVFYKGDSTSMDRMRRYLTKELVENIKQKKIMEAEIAMEAEIDKKNKRDRERETINGVTKENKIHKINGSI